ncbi:hypothetical protein BaRGS_00014325, partial [Batillaria attramentaria]
MAAVEQTTPTRSWTSFRAERTQARPKHSLFGTALEHYDKEDLKGISPSEASQIGVRKPRERYPIPEHLQQHVSARAIVEKVKGDIEGQTQQVTDARRQLQEKEQQALAFKPTSSGSRRGESDSHGWMTKKDLEHADEINAVGLGKKGSYNRDKYGHKPPTHNYTLIGDVLSKGNDFGRRQVYDPDQTLVDYNRQQNNNTGSPHAPVDNDGVAPFSNRRNAADELPPNIKHHFGTRICESLLADQKVVEDTLQKQKAQLRRAKPPLIVDTKDIDAKSSGNYFEIGHNTRYSVFPGHSVPKLESCMKSAHNEAVYLRRQVPPDEYRIVKDAYGKWREQEVLRLREQKLWDEYFKSLTKFAVTWDRSQTRPPPQIHTPPINASFGSHTEQNNATCPERTSTSSSEANQRPSAEDDPSRRLPRLNSPGGRASKCLENMAHGDGARLPSSYNGSVDKRRQRPPSRHYSPAQRNDLWQRGQIASRGDLRKRSAGGEADRGRLGQAANFSDNNSADKPPSSHRSSAPPSEGISEEMRHRRALAHAGYTNNGNVGNFSGNNNDVFKSPSSQRSPSSSNTFSQKRGLGQGQSGDDNPGAACPPKRPEDDFNTGRLGRGGDFSGNNEAETAPSRTYSPTLNSDSNGLRSPQNYTYRRYLDNGRLNEGGSFFSDERSNETPPACRGFLPPVKYDFSDIGEKQDTHISDETLAEMNKQNNNLQYERRAIRLGFNPPIVYDIVPPPLIPKQAASQKRLGGRPRLGKEPLRIKTAQEIAKAEEWRKKKERWTRAKPPMSPDCSEYEARASGSYFAVGQAGRNNSFPWFPVKVESETQDKFSDKVHLSRYPTVDEFRVIKDDY